MTKLSPELQLEIERRVSEGPYRSAEDLLKHALASLDVQTDTFDAWLEKEILLGIDDESVEMTDELMDQLYQGAISGSF